MKNPAMHMYFLLGPFILVGPLFLRKEWVIAFVFLIVDVILLLFIKYYEPIKKNKSLARAFVVYVSVSLLSGILNQISVISYETCGLILFVLLVIYFLKYNKFLLQLSKLKASDDQGRLSKSRGQNT